jgi:hypothetical protein
LDRNDWVSLGDLVEGENLATELGPISVSSLELYRTTEPVYNFETHGEHVYQVTQLGLLVHNAYTTLKSARQSAVRKAWKKEVDRVNRTGKGSVSWTRKQLQELLEKGKVSGFIGHHIKSVVAYPHLAGNPKNIQFLSRAQHLAAHKGNFANPTHRRFTPK